MSGKIYFALLASVSCLCFAGEANAIDASSIAEPAVIYARQPAEPARKLVASAERSNMGGGFIQFLFGDAPQGGRYQQQPAYQTAARLRIWRAAYAAAADGSAAVDAPGGGRVDPAQRPLDPKYEKQVVEYHGKEAPGTIVIDTPNKFLFLVQGDGKALRYGVGVGRPGFTWSGVKTISAKKEWPAWTPPPEMLARRPDLPRYMEGGPQNPLGARAMYLGSSLYRIHGSNEPWTIGTNVSSGCIRMRNEDVIDLYGRVGVGARVIVI